MGLTVVHKASPRVVDTVLERLRERGVQAVAIDDPNIIVLLVSFGTYRVRIAAPDEEAEEARRILAEWDQEAAPRVHDLVQQMRRQFLAATLVALVAGAVLFFAGGWEGRAHWVLLFLLLLWVGVLLALGVLQRVRDRRSPPGH